MFCMLQNKQIDFAHVPKHNSNREKQVILFNNSKWRRMQSKVGRMMVLSCRKTISTSLRSIASKNNDDF